MKLKITKEILERLYVSEKKSLSEIGNLYDVNSVAILYWLKKFNVQRRTLSQSLKGRKNTWGDKTAKSLKGRKRPGVGGRSKGCYGWSKGLTKLTDNRLLKTGKQKEQHWAWKGGVAKENALLRQTPEYKMWRQDVFKRDNWTCIKCNRTRCWLHAHHIKSFSDFPSERFNNLNGMTLCVNCHKEIHKNQEIDNVNE